MSRTKRLQRCLWLILTCSALANAPVASQDYALTFQFTPPSGNCGWLTDGSIQSCEQLNPNYVDFGGLTPNHAFFVITGVPAEDDGIQSVRFAIDYDPGVHIYSWGFCRWLEVVEQDDPGRSWPQRGTWCEVRWPECYQVTDNPIGATYFGYVGILPGSEGSIRIIGDASMEDQVLVTSCSGKVTRVCPDAWGVGDATYPEGTSGVNTCGVSCPTPVSSGAWGAIKAAYR